MRRRLGSFGIALCLLFAIVPTARAASDPSVAADNTAANHITTGIVLKADPAKALLEVKNNFHFWVAVEVQSATKVVLKPADWKEDLGGIFAAGGLINPGGTASWDAVFDPSSGGLATVHVHYDPLTSAGGAAALAANILTIIADSLGVSLSAADPGVLVTGFKILMDLPQFADFIREAHNQDIWGLATGIEIMLKSQTGRAAILEALSEFGVHAAESQLLGLSSLLSLCQWVQTITDLLYASFWGETDGTVTFWLAGKSVAAPPAPAASPAKWVSAGSLKNGRASTHAILLKSGNVLVVGDDNTCTPGWAWDSSIDAEIYDQSKGTWRQTGSLNAPRDGFAAVPLTNGFALVTGGENDEGLAYSSTKLYDPVAGAWSASGLLDVARWRPAYSVLTDGRVLVAGGDYMDNSTGYVLASAEIYDPASGTWAKTGSLRYARSEAQAVTLADGRVLVVGGSTADGTVLDGAEGAEIWDPSTGRWLMTGSLPTARTSFTLVALPDGTALAAGGFDVSGKALATADRLDPASLTWAPTGPMKSGAWDRSSAVLADGRVLVAGGLSSAGRIADAELFDPVSESWSATAPLPVARKGGSAVALGDGSVLLVGGDIYGGKPMSTPYCPPAPPEALRYIPGTP